MSGLLVLLPTLALLYAACHMLERRGRTIVVVLLMLSIALLDAVLYPTTATSSATNLFHPQLFGQNLRLTQLAVPVALLARLLTGGRPRTISLPVVLGAAFFAWVLVSTVTGLMRGNDPALVFRQATIIIHVGGGAVLAASVPVRDYIRGTTVPRFVRAAAVLAAALFVTDLTGIRVTSQALPILPVSDLGAYAADASTLFSSIGVLGLVLAAAKSGAQERARLALPSAVLVLSHLASPQRAARLGLYVTLLLVTLAFTSPTARRHLRLTPAEVVTTAACLAALVLGLLFWTAFLQGTRPTGSVAFGYDTSALAPRTRQGSIQSRYNQWAVAVTSIRQRPLVGNGLGDQQIHYEVGRHALEESDISHNIVLDILRRTGLVGVLFGGSALLVLCWRAYGVWRRAPDHRVAAFAVVTVAILGGLVAKGMVESIFEKNRLALLLGLVIGMALSAVHGGTVGADDGPTPPRPTRPRELARP